MTGRALAVLAGVLTAAAPAWACVQCNSGDPTISALGVERPYRNRLRLAIDESVTSHATGAMNESEQLTALRSTLNIVWAPHSRVILSAALPWVTAWARSVDETRTINGLGDLELTGRFVLVRDRRFAPHHLFAATAGIKAPTGPRVRQDGYPLPEDQQPGTGSWDPILGLSYVWVPGGMASLLCSTAYRYGTPGRRSESRGAVLSNQLMLQVQPLRRLAILGAVEVIHRWADRFATGAAQPDSGGTTVWLSPALLIAPTSNLVVRLGASIPVGHWLYGAQHEGPRGTVALAWDVL